MTVTGKEIMDAGKDEAAAAQLAQRLTDSLAALRSEKESETAKADAAANRNGTMRRAAPSPSPSSPPSLCFSFLSLC